MDIGTDREDREITHGSAPTVSALDGSSASFAPLRFDADKFISFVRDEDLTEDQALALLRVYWDIYVGFVDVAFGLHPAQQVVDRSKENSPSATGDSGLVVHSSASISSDQTDKTADDETAAKEDS